MCETLIDTFNICIKYALKSFAEQGVLLIWDLKQSLVNEAVYQDDENQWVVHCIYQPHHVSKNMGKATWPPDSAEKEKFLVEEEGNDNVVH